MQKNQNPPLRDRLQSRAAYLCLFLKQLRYRPGSFTRFCRVIGFFVVIYFGSMAFIALFLGIATTAGAVSIFGMIPIAAFIAYRLAHAMNRTLEGEKFNGRRDL